MKKGLGPGKMSPYAKPSAKAMRGLCSLILFVLQTFHPSFRCVVEVAIYAFARTTCVDVARSFSPNDVVMDGCSGESG